MSKSGALLGDPWEALVLRSKVVCGWAWQGTYRYVPRLVPSTATHSLPYCRHPALLCTALPCQSALLPFADPRPCSLPNCPRSSHLAVQPSSHPAIQSVLSIMVVFQTCSSTGEASGRVTCLINIEKQR